MALPQALSPRPALRLPRGPGETLLGWLGVAGRGRALVTLAAQPLSVRCSSCVRGDGAEGPGVNGWRRTGVAPGLWKFQILTLLQSKQEQTWRRACFFPLPSTYKEQRIKTKVGLTLCSCTRASHRGQAFFSTVFSHFFSGNKAQLAPASEEQTSPQTRNTAQSGRSLQPAKGGREQERGCTEWMETV